MSSFNWIETSAKETEFAKLLARDLVEMSRNPYELSKIIEDVALALTTSRQNARISALPKHLQRHGALWSNVDLKKMVADSPNDLSANIFGALSFEISKLIDEPAKRGLVATPFVLALDMAAAALSQWLAEQTGYPINRLIRACLGLEDLPKNDRPRLAALARGATWYDPAVGAGVFPLAIAKVLQNFGVPLSIQQIRKTLACADIDIVGATAARVRLALLIAHESDKSFVEAFDAIEDIFFIGDALGASDENQSLATSGKDSKNNALDIVIGNPPYVRPGNLPKKTRDSLKKSFRDVGSGQTDLYAYFIAHALECLKQGGVLCYVSPASFQKSRYGSKVRGFISKTAAVRAVFDFNELPVFQNASLHPSVYLLAKGGTPAEVVVACLDELPGQNPLLAAWQSSTMLSPGNFTPEGWLVAQRDSNIVLQKMRRNSVPLISYAKNILSGIKSSHKQAFILTKSTSESLDSDKKSSRWLKPLCKPRDIRAYSCKWDGSHMALIQKGERIPQDSRLMGHLKKFESSLRQRTDVKGHPTWYGLRECSYYNLFAKPKIIFPDIASECRFFLDETGLLITDGAFMLPVNDYFLLGILNSSVGNYYFRSKCNSIGNPAKGGRLRFKKEFVKEFPVPKIDSSNRVTAKAIQRLAKKLNGKSAPPELLKKIDALTLELYQLSENDLSGSQPPARPSLSQSGANTYSAPTKTPDRHPTCIDLFSGAGGLSLGFSQAGGLPVAAVDIDYDAMKTYSAMFPFCKDVHCGPIENWKPKINPGEVDVIIGGPPCQGFSLARGLRFVDDPRNHLYKQFVRIVDSLEPSWIVMENVPGIKSIGGGSVLAQILEDFRAIGYWLDCRVINMAEFGVPQSRKRAIFVGSRGPQISIWPTPSHNKQTNATEFQFGRQPFISVGDALGDLPWPMGKYFSHRANSQMRGPRNRKVETDPAFTLRVRGDEFAVRNTLATGAFAPGKVPDVELAYRPTQNEFQELMREQPPEWIQDWTPWPTRKLPIKRLSGSRRLATREQARLQTFPDWFSFSGREYSVGRQIGNAVPPLFARKLFSQIIAQLKNSQPRKRRMSSTRELVS